MEEFPQSMPNLTAASQNLYELIKGRGIAVYPDDDIRLAIQRAIAVEGPRGWKIAKEKTSHKIDIVVALAQAALAAVQKGELGRMRTGAIDTDGSVHWHETEPGRSRAFAGSPSIRTARNKAMSTQKRRERKILWTTTRSNFADQAAVSPGKECREHVKGG